jgi:Ca2+-binding RTX toxin-like protein
VINRGDGADNIIGCLGNDRISGGAGDDGLVGGDFSREFGNHGLQGSGRQ